LRLLLNKLIKHEANEVNVFTISGSSPKHRKKLASFFFAKSEVSPVSWQKAKTQKEIRQICLSFAILFFNYPQATTIIIKSAGKNSDLERSVNNILFNEKPCGCCYCL